MTRHRPWGETSDASARSIHSGKGRATFQPAVFYGAESLNYKWM